MRVFVLGYMGSGKSTVGPRLARKIGFEFLDLDQHIEAEAAQSISQIFELHGESYFRKIEAKALREVSENQNLLLSLGGGVPCFENNMEWMNAHGITVYVKMSPEMLASRLENGKEHRPLLASLSKEELLEFVKKHLEERSTFYEQAQIIADGGGMNATLLEELATEIKSRLVHH